jgi:REP element-mobilizing transposase RayT
MPQSLSQVYVHIVFSTKYRQPLIKAEVEKELFAYIGGIIKNNKGIPFIVNGMPDHIHIFSSLPRTISLAKYVEDIKRMSSRWIKTKGIEYSHFSWQRGYAAFSVCSDGREVVTRYIANQKRHHNKQVYKEEVKGFLEEYQIEYDETYLWD